MLSDQEWRAHAVTTLDTVASYDEKEFLTTDAVLARLGSSCKPNVQGPRTLANEPREGAPLSTALLPVTRADSCWEVLDGESYTKLCRLFADKPAEARDLQHPEKQHHEQHSQPQHLRPPGAHRSAVSFHPHHQQANGRQHSLGCLLGAPGMHSVTGLSAEAWLARGTSPSLSPIMAPAEPPVWPPVPSHLRPAPDSSDPAGALAPATPIPSLPYIAAEATSACRLSAGEGPAAHPRLTPLDRDPPKPACNDSAFRVSLALSQSGGLEVVPEAEVEAEAVEQGPLRVMPLLALLEDVAELTPLHSPAGSARAVSLTGTWRGAKVAVRLSFHSDAESAGPQLGSALLATRLQHPNLLRVLEVRAASVDDASLSVVDPPPVMRPGWGLRPEGRLQRFLSVYSNKHGILSASVESGAGSQDLTVLPGDVLCPATSPAPGSGSTLRGALRAMRAEAGGVVMATFVDFAELGNLQTLSSGSADSPFVPTRAWSPPVARRALLRTAREIASAMRALHVLGVTHGALRPSNVLLVPSSADRRGFEARVSDFGSPSLIHAAANPWASGPAIVLLAPEALTDSAAAMAPAADVYSYGMLLYLMAAGQMPFKGEHLVPVLVAIEADGRRPEWPVGHHDLLEPLYRRCVAQKPEDRPTFKQILIELSELEEQVKNPKYF